MKFFFLLTILSFTATASFSQEDKKAKGILDKLSAKTKAYTSVKTDFSYSLVPRDKTIKAPVQNWKLILKGERYRLDMGDQVLISDGKTLWKILKADKEVEISTPTGDDAMNPKNIFTMYEKGFKFKYVKEEKIGGKIAHIIDLFPTNPKEKDFNSIRLYIDKVAMQVIKSEIRGKNGNLYTYDIKKFTTNEAVDAGLLSFKPADYPGFEINDLR